MATTNLFHRDASGKADGAIGANAVDASDPIPGCENRRLLFGVEALLARGAGDRTLARGCCELAHRGEVLLALEEPFTVCPQNCPVGAMWKGREAGRKVPDQMK